MTELAKHSEKLLYFYEIANEKSLQAAGRKIGITAPSLSYAIKELERIVRADLFIRDSKGVTLTKEGERLYVFCNRFFKEMDDVTSGIITPDQQLKRRLRIGTFQSIAIYYWPILFDRLRNDPTISASISTNRSAVVLESLLKKEIDVAITVGTIKHPNLRSEQLYSDEYAFYSLKKPKKQFNFSRKELKEQILHYMPDATDENGKSLREYLATWGISFKEEFTLDSLEVILEFIKRDYGIGILPRRIGEQMSHQLTKITIEDVKEKTFGRHSFFVSYRNDIDLPQKTIDIFLSAAAESVQVMNKTLKDNILR